MSALTKPSPLIFIFITVFIDLMGGSLLVPVLPYLVERFRSDAVTIGLLTSVFFVAQFLATPVIGILSDRYGRRPVLLWCVLGTGFSYFVFGWAGALWLLFLSRVIAGATGGVIVTAQAYIADISPPEKRTQNFGLIGAAFGLGFTLGPAIGGALVPFGLNAPVFFAGGLALANAAFGYFTLSESLPPERRRSFAPADLNPIKQLGSLLADRRLRALVSGYFLFNFAFAGFTTVFAVFIRDRFGWGPELTVWVFAFIGVVSTIVQGGLIRRLLPRFGEARLAVAGLLLVAFALASVAILPSGIWLYPSQAILALGVGLATPSLRGMLSNSASDSEQGRVLGGTQSLISVAQIFGPLAASSSYDSLGRTVPFWGSGLLVFIAFGCIALHLRKSTLSKLA